MSSLAQPNHLAFADVCGNGITGNAGFYANLTRSSPTQFDNPPTLLTSDCPPGQLPPPRVEFSTYESRLASYVIPAWPTDRSVTPQLLAAAGLFYHGKYTFSVGLSVLISRIPPSGQFLGIKDAVQCYRCGVGLCLWQPGDDAWSEHKRVSLQCPFLQDIQNKEKYEGLKKNSNPSTHEITENLKSIQISKPETSEKKVVCERLTCKVCLEKELSILFLPCAHLVSCARCAANVTKCPVCRQPILRTISTFIG